MQEFARAWSRPVLSVAHGAGSPEVPARVAAVTKAAARGLYEDGPDQLAPGIHPALLAVVVRNLVSTGKGHGTLVVYTDLRGFDAAYADLQHDVVGRWCSMFPLMALQDGLMAPLPGQRVGRRAQDGAHRALTEQHLRDTLAALPDACLLVLASCPAAVPANLPKRRHIVIVSPAPCPPDARARLRLPLLHQKGAPCRLPDGEPWTSAQAAERNAASPAVEAVNVPCDDANLCAADVACHELFPYWQSNAAFVGVARRANARLQSNLAPLAEDEMDPARPEEGVPGLLASARGIAQGGRSPPTPAATAFLNAAAAAYETAQHHVPRKASWLRDNATDNAGARVPLESRRAAVACRRWLAREASRHRYTVAKADTFTVVDGPVLLPGAPTRAALAHFLHGGAERLKVLLYPWEAPRYNQAVRGLAKAAAALGVTDWPQLPAVDEPALPTAAPSLVPAVPDFQRFVDVQEAEPAEAQALAEDDDVERVVLTTSSGAHSFRAGRPVLVVRGDDVEEVPAQDVREKDVLVRLRNSSSADAQAVMRAVCSKDPRMSQTQDLALSWHTLLVDQVNQRAVGTASAAYRLLNPGVDRVQFGNWLRGNVVAPLQVNLRRLAEILGLPRAWADSVYAAANAHYTDRRRIRAYLFNLAKGRAHELYKATLADDGHALDILLQATSFEPITKKEVVHAH